MSHQTSRRLTPYSDLIQEKLHAANSDGHSRNIALYGGRTIHYLLCQSELNRSNRVSGPFSSISVFVVVRRLSIIKENVTGNTCEAEEIHYLITIIYEIP